MHKIFTQNFLSLQVLDKDRRHGRSISDLQHGYPAMPVTRDVIAQTSRRSLAAPRWVVSPKRLRNFEFENVYDDCIMNYFQISSISIYSAFLEETLWKRTNLQKVSDENFARQDVFRWAACLLLTVAVTGAQQGYVIGLYLTKPVNN